MPVITETTTDLLQRLRLTIRGIVQGVGFRPHVYGCAIRAGVSGFVGNDSNGVFIEAEGCFEALEKFQSELINLAPPLAHIEEIRAESIVVCNDQKFVIVESESEPEASTLISPDICICDDCLREIFDPQNRRYRYPFTNCTNCGPRFTIIKDIPYDRPKTTMANFAMCAECQREYEDPMNRRFHAQPNACANCGPQVEFVDQNNLQNKISGSQAIVATQQALKDGLIVAVKGIGGFHLACDAMNEIAVQKLRERKGRVDKPFAVMTRDTKAAFQFAEIDEQERTLLESKERPIVLLKKKNGESLSNLIAPGNDYIGVMLPYSPLHYLLFRDAEIAAAKVLVMTSGNYSNEPIVKDNTAALESLASLADAFLLHNRDIYVPCDDSVIRVFEGHELPVRRSRGYAPFPVKLPFLLKPTLAIGGELKATFCLIKEDHALMSQHLGDMENLETLQSMRHSLNHFSAIFRTVPEIVVGDKHPRYLSSQWAKANLSSLSTKQIRWVEVQHHHAHIASVMAENGLRGDQCVIGFAFDGTGYGNDGAIWGGEVMIADYADFKRAAHLQYVQLPGGDAAIKRPYRIALAWLRQAGVEWEAIFPPVTASSETERKILRQQLEKNLNTAPTSSIGRLFDAVAALAGVRQIVTYEAQAAIELEALVDLHENESYGFEFISAAPIQIDARPVIRAIAEDVRQQISTAKIAARFHNAVAEMIFAMAIKIRGRENLNQVALSGGVFQNATLLEKSRSKLEEAGFEVLFHHQVPPNDGGLALGQAVIANFIEQR